MEEGTCRIERRRRRNNKTFDGGGGGRRGDAIKNNNQSIKAAIRIVNFRNASSFSFQAMWPYIGLALLAFVAHTVDARK